MIETCEVADCEKPSRGSRLCPMHYNRMRRHGSLDGKYPQGDPFDRLMRRVEKRSNGCWVWTGKATKNGYAVTGTGGKHGGSLYGHRLAYERLVGPIPPDRPRLHHRCEDRLCVNPEHLEPVNASGHARHHGLGVGPCRSCGSSDWYIRPDNGARQCRECRRRRKKRVLIR